MGYTTDEAIATYGKRLHEFAEMFEAACKAGDGFEAMKIIGRIAQSLPAMELIAKDAHEGIERPEMRR